MLFWIITGALALAAAGLVITAMRRSESGAQDTAAFDLKVYKDQLAEVDRDLARGVLSETDAERVRIEISRRILALDEAKEAPSARAGVSLPVSAALALGILGASFVIYTQLGAPGYGDFGLALRHEMAAEAYAGRPAQDIAEAEADLPPPQDPPEEIADLVKRLRDVVATRPDDLRGHKLLARYEASAGHFAAARAAQERVVQLLGDDAGPTEWGVLGEMRTLAAGGLVTAEAEDAFRRALALNPNTGTASYYMGLMYQQTGRPDLTFRIWDELLRRGPEEAPWIALIRAQIDSIAVAAGVNYTQPVPVAAAPGPDADAIAAAGDMSAEDRQAMIEGMVEGLAARLSEDGGTPQEWARLINALAVLGRAEDARTALQDARKAHAGDSAALSLLQSAARSAGVSP